MPATIDVELLGLYRCLNPKANHCVMTTDAPALSVRDSGKLAPSRLAVSFWLDGALLVSICALQAVPFTGVVLHEWLGLGMAGMILVHLLLSWSWIASASRRLFSRQPIRARINALLNLSLFVTVTAAIFSGILISQEAIPTLAGAAAPSDMDWRWDTLHRQFSTGVIILAGFHLAINWDWVLAAGHKIFRRIRENSR